MNNKRSGSRADNSVFSNNNNNKIYFQSKQITAKYTNIYYGADKLDL